MKFEFQRVPKILKVEYSKVGDKMRIFEIIHVLKVRIITREGGHCTTKITDLVGESKRGTTGPKKSRNVRHQFSTRNYGRK